MLLTNMIGVLSEAGSCENFGRKSGFLSSLTLGHGIGGEFDERKRLPQSVFWVEEAD